MHPYQETLIVCCFKPRYHQRLVSSLMVVIRPVLLTDTSHVLTLEALGLYSDTHIIFRILITSDTTHHSSLVF